MIEIYLLEQLAAVAKDGTLSAAAEHLHLAQPSLSRSMQKLEDLLLSLIHISLPHPPHRNTAQAHNPVHGSVHILPAYR